MIYVNGEAINTTMFSDNTSQVWKLPLDKYKHHVSISWKYSYESEVMQLAQLKALLDTKYLSTDLDIDYLPYARQDKQIDNNATFALEVFAKILNGMKFDKIAIHDPHSLRAIDLINNSYPYYPIKAFKSAYLNCGSNVIAYPDAGAVKKYYRIYDGYSFVSADKHRDQLTGEITGMELYGHVRDKSVLIVDDICDGGRTFIELTKLLKEDGAKDVNLFVTHGIFSKGLRPLKDAGITNIYTAKGLVLKSHFQESY